VYSLVRGRLANLAKRSADPRLDRGGQDDADDHRIGGLAEEGRGDGRDGQQNQQRQAQLAHQYGQRPDPVRTDRVGARDAQPSSRLILCQTAGAAAQPGQHVVGVQHAGLSCRSDGTPVVDSVWAV